MHFEIHFSAINFLNLKPKKMKKIFTILFAALLAGSFAFVSCGQSGDTTGTATSKKDSPSKITEKAMKALKNKDYEGAVRYMAGIEDATDEDISQMAALIGMIYEANGGLKDYEILSEEISEDGQNAVVGIKYTFGNGETNEDTEKLMLTEKGWVIKE